MARPPPAALPVEVLTVEAATEAEAEARAAAEAATDKDKPTALVALRKATHTKARAVAHEALATWQQLGKELGEDAGLSGHAKEELHVKVAKARAILERQVNGAIVAACEVAGAEADAEGQTLTAPRKEKEGKHASAEVAYWRPFMVVE